MDVCIAGVVAEESNFFAASPLLVIEEALYATPTAACGALWDLVEARTQALMQPQLNVSTARTSQSKLSLLRFSNCLLRRLSPSMHAVLCGRIQLFLSNVLPLSERSALNLGGSFNAENETVFDTPPEGEEDTPQWLEYTSFWALHAFLANPLSTLKSADAWREFTGCVATTLDVLEAYTGGAGSASQGGDSAPPASAGSGAGKTTEQQDGHALVAESDSEDEQGAGAGDGSFFAPKFLTSFPLFDLQKRDPQVQRQVLVQILIVLRWLHRDRKTAPPTVDVDAFCVATERRCRKCLLGTGPGSAALVRALRQRLVEEQWWSDWKSQCRCASFEKAASGNVVAKAKAALQAQMPAQPEPLDAKDDVDAEFDAPARNGSCASIAWASQGLGIDVAAELMDTSRCPKPTLEQHIEAAADAINPESFFYDATWDPKELEADKRWVWRGTRLLAAHGVSLLQRMPKASFTSTALLAFGKRIPSEVAAEEAAKAKAAAKKESPPPDVAAAPQPAEGSAEGSPPPAAATDSEPAASPQAAQAVSGAERSPSASPSSSPEVPAPEDKPQAAASARVPQPEAELGEGSDSGEELEGAAAAKRARRGEEIPLPALPAASKAASGGPPVGPAKPPPAAPPSVEEAASYSSRGGRIRMGSIAEEQSGGEVNEGSHPLPQGEGGGNQYDRRGASSGGDGGGGGRQNRQQHGGGGRRGGGGGGDGERPRGRGSRRGGGGGGGRGDARNSGRKRRRGD